MDWEIATPVKKKYKLFFWGPEGCFKTRTALRLGNVPGNEEPALAVIDTEFGTDHYGGEFRFRRKQTVDPDEVFNLVKGIIQDPNGIKTLMIDSFSVYYEAVVSKYADLFLRREITSQGNKKDYYVIQPKDYQAINREVYNLIRMLIACDLNVIAIGHAKDKWGTDMRVIGKVPDGPKKMSYYFDTVVEIEDAKDGGFQGLVRRKDRTHSLVVQEIIPWNSDKAAAEYIAKAFGHDLSVDAVVDPGKIINPKGLTQAQANIQKEVGVTTQGVTTLEVGTPPVETAEPNAGSNGKLQQIATLKQELNITDRDTWLNLLMPYNAASARELDAGQLADFVKRLEALRPTESLAS